MKLTDSRDIKADPQVVWDAILNPEVLKECIPGCESLTGSVAEGYEAVVKQKVGPVSATFTGLVQLSDIVPGKSLKISGEGKGGVAGFAKKLADEFFTRFQAAVEEPEAEEAPEEAVADSGEKTKGWFRRLLG